MTELLGQLARALLHESNVARNDPDPVVGHRLIAYDAGLPKSLIRFSTLHARTASAPCPAELRARKPSPDGLVPEEDVLHARLPMVARLLLPSPPPDLLHPLDGTIASEGSRPSARHGGGPLGGTTTCAPRAPAAS